MPATFGTGTAGVGQWPQSFPDRFADPYIAADETVDITFAAAGLIYVITAIDIVSFTAGAGGFVTFSWAGSAACWWSINYGSDVDTFHWRGWMVSNGGTTELLRITNTGTNDVGGSINGLIFTRMPS